MKAYICEKCNAQLNPNDIKDGVITCPYCGQIYSMSDETNYKTIRIPVENQNFDFSKGEKAFKKLFGE